MDNDTLYDVIVVGGGPAGLTAALYLARARYRVVVLEKERFGGQITITEEVVNYPGVERTSGSALAETMRRQAESFGAEFMLAQAHELVVEGDVKTVRTSNGDIRAFGILVATGARPRRLGFPGEEEFQGRGVAYCATCDGEFFTDREVFVIGGGFAAAEESVFLAKYAKHVTVMMRGDDFSCAKSAAEPALSHPKITVMRNTEVERVGGESALSFLAYRNNVTGERGEYRAAQGDYFGVFVLAGYEPETSLLRGVAELTEAGYAVVDKNQRTSAEGVYAAGDVCAKSLRQVVTATGEGALAATELERFAAVMQKKTGLVPEARKGAFGRDADGRGPVGPGANANAGGNAKAAAGAAGRADAAAHAGASSLAYLDESLRPQLETVFAKMAAPVVLELTLDDRPVSAELLGWMEELASFSDKLSVTVSEETGLAPCVRIVRSDGQDAGLAFFGVPGGHEFTSFVLGIYNAAGPGQPIDDALRTRIEAISRPVKLDVLVSLSCTNCPDVVVASQRIASLSPHVEARAFDINHFPELKERYNVMSVPCLVVDDGARVAFGKKGIAQVLEEIERAK